MDIFFNNKETFDDFEGLVSSESFDTMDDWGEMVDFAENDFDEFDSESVTELAERINEDVKGMSFREAEAYLENTFTEAFPLLPLLAALAPVVAPMVVQGVSSLVSKVTNQPASPQPRPALPPRQTAPNQPVTQPNIATQSPATPMASQAVNPASSATTLLGLLQNPAVIQAITGIVQSAGTGGNPQVNDLLLGTLAQLASNTRSEMFGESAHDYPDFLFDTNGNLTADPFAPEQMADLLTQQLAAYS